MAKYGRVWRSMAEYGRARRNMREYSKAKYQCTYARAMVELWVSITDYSEAAYQDH